MHIRELIMALGQGQLRHVGDLGPYDEHRPRSPPRIHRVKNDQSIGRIEQLLHQVNPTDADIDYAHLRGKGLGEKAMGGDDAESIVPTQEVSHACHENLHRG